MSCFTCEECGIVAYQVTNYANEAVDPMDPPIWVAIFGGWKALSIGNCYPDEVCPPPSFPIPCITPENGLLFMRPDLEGPQIQTYRIHVIKENGVRLVYETFAFQLPYSNQWYIELPYSVLMPFIQGYEGTIKFELYNDHHLPVVFFSGDMTGSNYNPICLVMKVINAPFSPTDWNTEQGFVVPWVPPTTTLI